MAESHVHPDAQADRVARYTKAAQEKWSAEFNWGRHLTRGTVVGFSAKFWTLTVRLWDDHSIVDLPLSRTGGIRMFPSKEKKE